MEICLARFERPIILSLRNGSVYIDNELQPIKNVTEEELALFAAKIDAIPKEDSPGYEALRNAKRTELVVSLLGRAVGDECIDYLSSILDRLHLSVLDYLDGARD